MSVNENRKPAAWIALALCLVVGVVLIGLRFRSAPQMGADPEVFKTVDALFTAVTSRNQRQLDGCDQRLQSYRNTGQLPPAAADYLNVVVADAKSGKWEPAAHSLYDFMIQQRR